MKIEFEVTENLALENSFGIIKDEDNVVLHITINVDDDYGYFELYDIETGGDDWYAEGGLWFEGNKLVDYDGVYSLLTSIIDKLKELGYDMSYAE
jgi:hypothetical protein